MKRSHRLYEPLQRAVNLERLRDLASEKTLLSARYEPATRQNRPAALLDLAFERDGSIGVLPFVLVDVAMLIEPEDDVFIWPHAATGMLDSATFDGIAAVLIPWLQAQTFGRGAHRELVRTFGDAKRVSIFERAREAGFLGAAPYTRVLADCAPALYAIRFADGKSVAAKDARASAAALALARNARACAADLADEALNDLSRRWYGYAGFRSIDEKERFDVCAGADPQATFEIACDARAKDDLAHVVTRPLPLSVMVSFDPQDGPAVANFGVRVRERAQARRARFGYPPAPGGGSSGRILITVRKDAEQQPDADVDDALELARRLRVEGFTVDVHSHLAQVDRAAYDLVHAFGAFAVDDAIWSLEQARNAGRPTVLTTGLEDVAARGVWGMGVANSLFASFVDERALAEHLEGLRTFKVFTPELPPQQRHEPIANFEQRVRALMELADVVLVSGAGEEQLLDNRFGRHGDVHVSAPYLNAAIQAECVDELAGDREFVLAHAPIDMRCNQVMLVRALRELGLPLVLLGPVADAQYLELVREQAGDRVYFVPDATRGQVAGLYSRARVYADVAWIGYGLRRIAQAAAYGCALAVANLRYAGALWRPGLWEVDPASVSSIAAGIGDAWAYGAHSKDAAACAERIAAGCDPVLSLVATATAYAQAQKGRLNYAAAPAEIER